MEDTAFFCNAHGLDGTLKNRKQYTLRALFWRKLKEYNTIQTDSVQSPCIRLLRLIMIIGICQLAWTPELAQDFAHRREIRKNI
jgi:hypothetical protein